MIRLGDILDLEHADEALASRAIGGTCVRQPQGAAGRRLLRARRTRRTTASACRRRARARARPRSSPSARRRSPSAAFVKVADARAALARAAARFYPRQPETIVAVTGTSGKTSVAAFVRQIWPSLGREAASLGTIGVVSRPLTVYGSLTTPDPIALHRDARPARRARRHPSRDGGLLARPRPEAARRRAPRRRRLHQSVARPHGLSRDGRGLSRRQAAAVPRASAGRRAGGDRRRQRRRAARDRGGAGARPRASFTVGAKGEAIRLSSAARDGFSSTLDLEFGGRRRRVKLAAAGRFPGLQRAGRRRPLHRDGQRADAVFAALQSLEGAPGRLERVGDMRGAPVFVDYAHKPDALEKALAALRPFVRGRLIVVFGCGGDRDAGKRPIMGEIATRCADVVIVTDDNPRSENPGRDPRRRSSPPRRARSRSATAARRSARASRCLRDGDALSSRAKATKPARSSATGRCRSPTPTKRARRCGRRA